MRSQTRNPLRTGWTLAATALAVAACGGGGERAGEPVAQNSAPTISAIADRSIDQDQTDAGVSFAIADAQTGAGGLNVVARSSDEALLPASGVLLGGSGTNRTLSLRPAENATGTATVTVTVTDPQGSSTSGSFRLTVNPVFVSFTGYTIDTFAVVEDEAARSMVGFTLDADADDSDTPFAALLP